MVELPAVMSLSRTFNILFICAVALPILGVNILLSTSYTEALFSVVARQTNELNKQTTYSVAQDIDRVSIVAAALVFDSEIRQAAKTYTETANTPEKTDAGARINERLSNIFLYSNVKGGGTVYFKNGRTISFTNMANLNLEDGMDKTLYEETKREPGVVHVSDRVRGLVKGAAREFMMTALIAPPVEEDHFGIEAIQVTIAVPYLEQVWNLGNAESGWGIMLVGRGGGMLLSNLAVHPDNATLSRLSSQEGELDRVSISGKSFLLVSKQLESSGWTVVSVFDREKLTGKLSGYFWYIYPALGIIIALFLFYSYFFFSRVAKPISSVIRSMHRFAEGNDTVSLEYKGIAELHDLVSNFNTMVEKINLLNKDREQKEKLRLQSEIAALQFQINPHFLVNTLNSIRLMAMASKSHAIREMVQSLIGVLRDSYASGESLTLLRNEIHNLQGYIHIMKVRFGENFDVAFDIPDDTLDLVVLRMILQPIVENAILHGVIGLDRKGLIRIEARRVPAGEADASNYNAASAATGNAGAAGMEEPADSGFLELCVSDNGKGMPVENTIIENGETSGATGPVSAENRKGFNRVGIRNVHDRIRLNFGSEYGLTIDSQPGTGTKIKFVLPIRTGEIAEAVRA